MFNHRPFLYFFIARAMSSLAYQVSAVALGWQIYALTGSKLDLGLAGLAQFVPMAALTFLAGHAADRFERKRVVQICQSIEGLAAVFLAWGSFAGWLTVGEIFAVIVVFGTARAFESPASAALAAAVIPEGMMAQGMALSSGAGEAMTMVGPAIGGLIYALSPGLPYSLMAVSWLVASLLYAVISLARPVEVKAPPDLRALFAGVGFVRHHPSILGVISLDLFAVLLGGATALLPVYAKDILHTGPWGLGLLRGAPAVGSLVMTLILARYAMQRRVGMRMFQAVIIFGLATIVFAVSKSMVMSLVALVLMGASDSVSVVIRMSLVQLQTPDEMRGRVSAVNFLFINASNNLGEFESGVTAALLGTVPAALLGGVGTVLVALLWMRLFPGLRQMERLE